MSFRWAFVSNTTLAPLVQPFKKQLQVLEPDCEIHTVEYGQCFPQILQPQSPLHAFHADVTVVYLDLEELRAGLSFSLALETAESRKSICSELVGTVLQLVRGFRANSTSALLLNSFPVHPRTTLGIGMDPIYRDSIRRMNLELAEGLAGLDGCHLYDLDSLWSEVGYRQWDRRFEDIARFAFPTAMQELLISEWLRFCRSLRGGSRKCVIVDLDNTLWGGILGEDGPAALQMGDTPQGRPFRRLQQALKALRHRGVLLAICSKNNLAEVQGILREHPDMFLREEDFAAMRVNWEDKSANILSLANELKLRLQSLVFLDDNPAERLRVRQACGGVLVPELPKDPSLYADVLMQCEMDSLVLTEEDFKRTEMIRAEQKREELKGSFASFEDFLAQLELKVSVERLTPNLLDRAFQLCQRTNQFNLTTRRHSVETMRGFMHDPESDVFLVKITDRFGEYGWSGMVIARYADSSATFDTFLLSCRVLGKNVEFAMVDAVRRAARKRGCARLRGQLIRTGKNAPCADFYPQCGFRPTESVPSTEGEWFEADLDALRMPPLDRMELSFDGA